MSPFSSERILWTDLSPSCISVGPSALARHSTRGSGLLHRGHEGRGPLPRVRARDHSFRRGRTLGGSSPRHAHLAGRRVRPRPRRRPARRGRSAASVHALGLARRSAQPSRRAVRRSGPCAWSRRPRSCRPCTGPARPSTASTPASASGCAPGAPRTRSAPTSPRRSPRRGTSAPTSSSSPPAPTGRAPPPRAVRPCRARRRARRRRHRRAGAQRPLQRFDAVQPQRAGLAPSRLSPVGVGPGETAAGQCGARPTRPSGGDGTGLGPCERTRPPSHDRRVLCRHVVRAIVNNLGPLLFVIHGGHRQQEGLPAGPDRARAVRISRIPPARTSRRGRW